jgi:two-component system response regulator FixJ
VPHGLEGLLDDVPPERLEDVRAGLNRLTPRELVVLRRVIAGETAEASSRDLGITTRTVELHRQQILAKLTVKNMTQAVRMIALLERDQPREH